MISWDIADLAVFITCIYLISTYQCTKRPYIGWYTPANLELDSRLRHIGAPIMSPSFAYADVAGTVLPQSAS